MVFLPFNGIFTYLLAKFLLFSTNSYLYTVLADASVGSVPILIACNKQDETFAKASSVVKNLLEKEL